MDNVKNYIAGGIITLIIGGTAFTFSQQAVVDNFANDTGLTQEQAEQYVNSVSEDDLVTFDVLGDYYKSESKTTLELANSVDCANYEYEWESVTLSCETGKAQLKKIGNTEEKVGQAYIQLHSDDATEHDIQNAISHLDQLSTDYELEIAIAAFDNKVLEEIRMTNSFNKSLLKAALESK